MEKSRRRAERRYHADRKLNRAIKVVSLWFPCDNYDEQFIRLMARKRRDNMQTCSRPFCCGNPRRSGMNRLDRLTIAEVKADDAFNDMTLDVERADSVGSPNEY